MSGSRKVDPRFRKHLQSLKRAGMDVVAAERFNVVIEEASPATVEPPTAAEPVTRRNDESLNVAASPIMEDSKWQNHDALKVLSETVAGCTKCPELVASRTRTVFADGSFTAEVCFIGEAPGADEDVQGVPFVGRAGQLLTRVIEAGFKMKREDVFICNVVKCRPEGNRNPTWTEMTNCQGYLIEQLKIVQPKVIVALGKHALAFLLGQTPEKTPIGKLRGQWHSYEGIPVMPTWHPAYILRQGDQGPAKRELWEDVKEVLRKLGRIKDEG